MAGYIKNLFAAVALIALFTSSASALVIDAIDGSGPGTFAGTLSATNPVDWYSFEVVGDSVSLYVVLDSDDFNEDLILVASLPRRTIAPGDRATPGIPGGDLATVSGSQGTSVTPAILITRLPTQHFGLYVGSCCGGSSFGDYTLSITPTRGPGIIAAEAGHPRGNTVGNTTNVSEPISVALAGLGLVGGAFARRKRAG